MTSPAVNKIKYECKHAVYAPSNDPESRDDLVVVKEIQHLPDGTKKPNLRLIRNYKRSFYLTREAYRDHKDNKEWESINRLQKFTCRQSDLVDRIGQSLGYRRFRDIGHAGSCEYLYGSDITTPTLIKHKYMEQWPDAISDNSVAVLDIETDVLNEDNLGKPIYIALTFRDKAFLVVTERFLGSIANPEEQFQSMFTKYLGKYKEERNINLEVVVTNDLADGIVQVINKAHEWKPDFLTFWNIDFDLPIISKVLVDNGYDLAQVFSDPSVPDEFKYYKYTKGKSKKETASGLVMSIHPAERWHIAECPASFFLIDSMCVYKRIRMAKANENSYSLDSILNKHLKLGKLNFKEAESVTDGGLKWHKFMQAKYKIEYGIYCLFDCIGVELLDEKTRDLAAVISAHSKASEYTIFNSQPQRLINDIYFYCLEIGKVIGSYGRGKDELDKFVVGLKDWIVTLPSHLVETKGIPLLKELPQVFSFCYAHVADLDIVSTYPNVQYILNISKETTYREISRVGKATVGDIRMAGINLSGGYVNAVEVVCSLYKAPTFDTLLEDFVKEKNIEAIL